MQASRAQSHREPSIGRFPSVHLWFAGVDLPYNPTSFLLVFYEIARAMQLAYCICVSTSSTLG